LNLRRETGATIIAVVRERIPDTNPGADFELKASDVLVLVGAHEQLRDARNLLEASSHLTSVRVELQDDDS
jgi:K+/H+ antiporter YhaU regulatory subunit KhtT